ncbi:MAG TPA: restriction endonuclease, partial [Haloplasmataceae bacterium]
MYEMKFYKHPIFSIFLLIIYPPLGITALWVFSHFDILIRVIISFFFGLLYLEFIGLYSSFTRALIYTLIFAYLIYRYKKLQEIELKSKTILNYCLNNLEIRKLIYNYLTKFISFTHCFYDLLIYEVHFREKYPIIYKHLTLTHLEDTYVNFISKETKYYHQYLKKNEETINKLLSSYKEKNLNYDQDLNYIKEIIKEKLDLDSEIFISYLTFELIKKLAIDYYSEKFHSIYGNFFCDTDLKILDNAVNQYVNLDFLNDHINSQDMTEFTYYLMKCGTFNDDSDYYYCINKICSLVTKAYQERKKQKFHKHLHDETEKTLKEIESLEELHYIKTQDQFKEYCLHLLKALGYENIVTPLNNYLDFLVSLKDINIGIITHYLTKNDEKITTTMIQDLKTGLLFNDLHKGIIITNGLATHDALDLASKNNIMIWDKDLLQEKIKLVKRYQVKINSEPQNEIKITDILTIPYENITLEHIDKMSGIEFQYYLGELFKRLGYKIISINKTRDKGVDLIIEKESIRFGIQAKRAQEYVDENAVKEVIAGLPYYNLQKGMVISNNYFDSKAQVLAHFSNITLWD